MNVVARRIHWVRATSLSLQRGRSKKKVLRRIVSFLDNEGMQVDYLQSFKKSARTLNLTTLEMLNAVIARSATREHSALVTFIGDYFPQKTELFSPDKATQWIEDCMVFLDIVREYMQESFDHSHSVFLAHSVVTNHRRFYPVGMRGSRVQELDLLMVGAALVRQLSGKPHVVSDLNRMYIGESTFITNRTIINLVLGDHDVALRVRSLIEDEGVLMEAQLLAHLQGVSKAILEGAL